MKIKKTQLLLIFLLFLSLSCKDKERIYKPDMNGLPGQITIVMKKNLWDGELGKGLKSIFEKPQPGLIRDEPMFDIRRIDPNAFSDLYKRKRNLIIIQLSNKYNNVNLHTRKDVWSNHQLVITIDAPNEHSAMTKLNENADSLINLFISEERNRSNIFSKKRLNNELIKTIKNKYKITLNIPKGISLYATHPDFLWMGKEKTDLKQHLCIYFYPYIDTGDFNIKSLILRRNEFMKKYIQGRKSGSYMTTELLLPPVLKKFNYKGRFVYELRGIWRMDGGSFMGGSFVSLSSLDLKRSRVVTIEGYVYNPNKKQRNLLRELEAIMYSFDFNK